MTGVQVRRFAVTFVVLLTVACGGDSDGDNPVGPNADTPGITNTTDNFQFNLPNVSNYSTNGGYTWRNNGTVATVTQKTVPVELRAIGTIRQPRGAPTSGESGQIGEGLQMV